MKTKFLRGAETRERMIRTAADLFHKQGARATSPDEIIEASRTGKGQFYYYFGSKEGLVHEVLQTYLEEIKTNSSRVNYEINSWRDLEKWFTTQIDSQKKYEITRGCPFGTLGNEVTDGDELIRQDLSLIFEVMNKLAAFFVKEKAIGRLAKRADSEHLADFCAAIHGAMLMGRVEATVQETLREGVVNLQIIGRLFFAKVVRWWLLAGIVFIGSCAVADAVTEWNERALACALTAKQPSTAAVRTLAMVHVAMFGAVNSVEHGYAPYKVKVSAPSGSSAEAAAIAAAHTVLVKLFRDQGKDLDAAYTASLAVVPDGSAKESGVAVGEKVAGEIISLRANDGADAPNQYRPVTAPGVYVVTTLPVGSQLPGVTPWLMERASQFRP